MCHFMSVIIFGSVFCKFFLQSYEKIKTPNIYNCDWLLPCLKQDNYNGRLRECHKNNVAHPKRPVKEEIFPTEIP